MDSEPKFVPWPLDPWNEIIPGLWQGGQIATRGVNHTHPNVVRVEHEFDAVFSFFWRDEEGNGPPRGQGIPHYHYYIPDGKLSLTDLNAVKDYARRIAVYVTAGSKILVRCQAGYNRSGLVVALALIELGWTPEQAIGQIRAKRSIWALHNIDFVRYIMEAVK